MGGSGPILQQGREYNLGTVNYKGRYGPAEEKKCGPYFLELKNHTVYFEVLGGTTHPFVTYREKSKLITKIVENQTIPTTKVGVGGKGIDQYLQFTLFVSPADYQLAKSCLPVPKHEP